LSAQSEGGWTKWWWLRFGQVGAWSGDERRAFGFFILTWGMAVAISAYPALILFTKLLGLSPKGSVIVWLIIAWPINLPGLRGLTSTLFPRTVIRGDDAAARRLGGRVFLPTNEFWIRNLWWIDVSLAKGIWSDEQMKVRGRTFLVSLCIFVPAFLIVASQLMSFGISERVSALIAFALIVPCALYAGRRFLILRWPDLVKKADDDAVAIVNRSIPPRT
jgi:hypothetical protein